MVILEKMNSFVVRQVEKMKEKMDEKTLFRGDNTEDVSDEENYEEEILVESDDGNDGENKDAGEQEESRQSDKNTKNDVIVLD